MRNCKLSYLILVVLLLGLSACGGKSAATGSNSGNTASRFDQARSPAADYPNHIPSYQVSNIAATTGRDSIILRWINPTRLDAPEDIQRFELTIIPEYPGAANIKARLEPGDAIFDISNKARMGGASKANQVSTEHRRGSVIRLTGLDPAYAYNFILRPVFAESYANRQATEAQLLPRVNMLHGVVIGSNFVTVNGFPYESIGTNLDSPDELDGYDFTLVRAQLVDITTAGLLNTYGELFQHHAELGIDKLIAANDDGGRAEGSFRIRRILPAGDYRLEVSNRGERTGPYNLKIDTPALKDMTITSLPYTSELTSLTYGGEIQIYHLSLAAPAMVNATAEGDADPYLQLYDAQLNELSEHNDSSLNSRSLVSGLLPAGSYYLVVRGGMDYSRVGDYQLQIEMLGSEGDEPSPPKQIEEEIQEEPTDEGVVTNDPDYDGIANEQDVDDDGDGLIEISNLAELDSMRNDLRGRSLHDGLNANKKGCGNGKTRLVCSGYELTADIDLASLIWQPIGHCNSLSDCSHHSENPNSFNAIFDGNGHSIRNLNLHITENLIGVGLFGAAGQDGRFRNLTIDGVSITADEGARAKYVGGLLGYGDLAGYLVTDDGISMGGEPSINRIQIIADEINGHTSVGALAGRVRGGVVFASSARANQVNGVSQVGGLIGSADNLAIFNSYVGAHNVTGSESIGGLVGDMISSEIFASFGLVATITGEQQRGNGLGISGGASGGISGGTSHGRNVGGMVGTATNLIIHSSYLIADSISGSLNVGGFIGDASTLSSQALAIESNIVYTSYLLARTITGGYNTGLFAGSGQSFQQLASYGAAEVNGVQAGLSPLELIVPTDFAASEIYQPWANVWCEGFSGDYSYDSQYYLGQAGDGDTYRAWDLGVAGELPALRCLPVSPEEQRANHPDLFPYLQLRQ